MDPSEVAGYYKLRILMPASEKLTLELLCRFYMRRKMGPPGGAICSYAEDMASCPRFDYEHEG